VIHPAILLVQLNADGRGDLFERFSCAGATSSQKRSPAMPPPDGMWSSACGHCSPCVAIHSSINRRYRDNISTFTLKITAQKTKKLIVIFDARVCNCTVTIMGDNGRTNLIGQSQYRNKRNRSAQNKPYANLCRKARDSTETSLGRRIVSRYGSQRIQWIKVISDEKVDIHLYWGVAQLPVPILHLLHSCAPTVRQHRSSQLLVILFPDCCDIPQRRLYISNSI
jgi:hypothetical protein